MSVMRRIMSGFSSLAVAVLFAADLGLAGDGKDALLDGFRSPPALARPEVWWHWMNGNVSKAGITADLEAMARVGIGGAHIFDVIGFIPEGPVAFGSEAWFDHLLFAHREARRLGLRLTVANCSGFSASGGPWVTPDDAMKFVVWTETEVAAGGRFSGELPRYKTDNGYYEDLCVKAVRLPERLRRGRKEGRAEVSCVRTNKTTVFEFGFARPWAAGELTFRKVDGIQWTPNMRAKVEVSDDGKVWRTVHDAVVEKWYMGEHTDLPRDIRFPEALSRHYRVTMTSTAIEDVDVGFFARSGDYPSLTYRVAGSLNPYVEPHVREGIRGDEVVAESDVVDLTGRMDASGRLDWQAPQGRWKVLRFGAIANGETCIQPSRAGSGPEVDKFSSSAVRRHFDAYLRKVARLAEIDPKSDPWTRTGIVSALVDSYEAGGQNWTQGFAAEFRRRRGRELLGPFFAAMAGFVVGDAVRTEAFLQDYRRTCHELFAEGYPDTLAACCEEVGLLLAIEPYGTQPCPTAMYGRKVHLPMAEFWLGGSRPWLAAGEVVESRMIPPVVETAHACGRKYIGAESFTAFPGTSSWRDSPYGFKAQGDTAYAQGVNRIVYHTFAHQPWTDPPRYPGMTMGQWGSQFNRMETWWEQVGGLVAYQTRTQYLLQEGRFVGKGKIGSDVRWLRRAYDDGSEGWFVACSSNGVRRLSLPFSVSGRTAEVWDAETGEIRLCGKELVLRPRGSAFVLFRPTVTRGIGAAEKKTVVVSRREQKGPWQVEFPFDWQTCSPHPETLTFDGLVSWPEHARDDVRHFSGTATYSVEVGGFPAAPGERIWLDLGKVHEIADVRVNGKAYPSLWRPPYRVDVTEALQAGRTNRLEIRVTNLWPNRLIGDAFKAEDCTWNGSFLSRWPDYVREGGKSPTGRSTFTTFRHWGKNSKLLPSGLLGPVVLESRLERGTE